MKSRLYQTTRQSTRHRDPRGSSFLRADVDDRVPESHGKRGLHKHDLKRYRQQAWCHHHLRSQQGL